MPIRVLGRSVGIDGTPDSGILVRAIVARAEWAAGTLGGRGLWGIVFTVDELATIPLFSALAEKELEYLAGAVEDIHLMPGEYVAHEGEGRFLAVVVEGKTELTKLVNGVEQVIGVRLPGELGGEIPMTLGTPLPASMRAVEPSRVLKLTVEVFHTLAAMAPQVSATVGAAALERMEMLRSATAQPLEPAMFVIGPRLDPGVHAARASSIAIRFPTIAWTRTIPPLLHAPEAEPPWPPPIRWWSCATALG